MRTYHKDGNCQLKARYFRSLAIDEPWQLKGKQSRIFNFQTALFASTLGMDW